MRKLFRPSILIILLCSIYLVSYLYTIIWGENIKYPSGFDTVRSFGDGTYQIVRNNDKSMCLLNSNFHSGRIENKIYKYEVKGDRIYVCGAIGYTIINYKANELKQYLTFQGYDKNMIEQYKSLDEKSNEKYYGDRWVRLNKYDDFTEKERKIFEDMK